MNDQPVQTEGILTSFLDQETSWNCLADGDAGADHNVSKDKSLKTSRELNINFTRFISVSNALPETSYVKMVDIFLLASLTVPFVEVSLFTFLTLKTWKNILTV